MCLCDDSDCLVYVIIKSHFLLARKFSMLVMMQNFCPFAVLSKRRGVYLIRKLFVYLDNICTVLIPFSCLYLLLDLFMLHKMSS
jgi:hypothetical protein